MALEQVSYTTDAGVQRRLFVGRCTVMDIARHNVYMRQGSDWMETQGHERSWSAEDTEDVGILRLCCYNRAQAMAALKRMEESADGENWQEVAKPATWEDVGAFFDDVPFLLLAQWAAAAVAANPGVWTRLLDEPEKNADTASGA